MLDEALFVALQIAQSKYFTKDDLAGLGRAPSPELLARCAKYQRAVIELITEYINDYREAKPDTLTEEEVCVLDDLPNKLCWIFHTDALYSDTCCHMRTWPLLTPALFLVIHKAISEQSNAWREVRPSSLRPGAKQCAVFVRLTTVLVSASLQRRSLRCLPRLRSCTRPVYGETRGEGC